MTAYTFIEILTFFIISFLKAFRKVFFPEWAQPRKSLEGQVRLSKKL